MREVKAIIRPQRLEHVMAALHEIPGLPGVTVSKVHAYAGSVARGREQADWSAERDFTKLEIIVPVDLVERVVGAIGLAGHTGHPGDGIVFVVSVEQFVRIRDARKDGSSSTAETTAG